MRRCIVLAEKEIRLEDIKKGQVFRLLPDGDNDVHANPDQWCIAEEDGFIHHDVPGVKCSHVVFVKTADLDVRAGLVTGKSADEPKVTTRRLTFDALSKSLLGESCIAILDKNPEEEWYTFVSEGGFRAFKGRRIGVQMWGWTSPSRRPWDEALAKLRETHNVSHIDIYECLERQYIGICLRGVTPK